MASGSTPSAPFHTTAHPPYRAASAAATRRQDSVCKSKTRRPSAPRSPKRSDMLGEHGMRSAVAHAIVRARDHDYDHDHDRDQDRHRVPLEPEELLALRPVPPVFAQERAPARIIMRAELMSLTVLSGSARR